MDAFIERSMSFPPSKRNILSDEEFENLSLVLGYDKAALKREFMGDRWRTHGDITRLLLDRIQTAVAEQINGLLLKVYKSPYTEHVLPLRRLGDDEPISWRWNTYTYEQGIANEIEQEGLARLHSSTKTEHGARMVRRGLAIKIEENFYRTHEGMARYREQVEQMATSILRTHEMDIMLSLLNTPAMNLVRSREDSNQIYGLDVGLRADERLQRQIDCFGMVNKNNEMGFTNMTAFLIGQMRNKGVDPDCIIVPPNLLNYYYATNPGLNKYSEAGSSIVHARDIATGGGYGANGFRRDEFNGLRVIDTYVQRMVEGAQQNVTELLTVNKQIGEFYPMLTKHSIEEIDGFNKKNKPYSGKMRNIYIYDEDLDRKVRVDYVDAVKNCMRWNEDGTINEQAHEGLYEIVDPNPIKKKHRSKDIFVKDDTSIVKTFDDISEGWITDESWNRVAETIKLYFDINETTKKSLDNFFVHLNTKFGAALRVFNACNKVQKGEREVTDIKNLFLFKRVISKDGLQEILNAETEAATDYNAYNRSTDSEKSTAYTQAKNIDKKEIDLYQSLKCKIIDMCLNEQVNIWNIWTRITYSDLSSLRIGVQHTDFPDLKLDDKVGDKVGLNVFKRTPVTRQNIINLHNMDIYIPIDFILARPYMTYETSSTIILKAGQTTGETLIAQERFQMTTNIADRTLYANVFYYGKAVVRKPRNVVVAPNVFIQRYLSGNNTKFITPLTLKEIQNNGGITQAKNESILAFATKVNDTITDNNVMDIRGENKDLANYCGKLATSEYYKRLLNIPDEKIHSLFSNHQEDYETRALDPNTVCMLGHTEDSERRVIYYCTGHLGRVTVDGIGTTRKPGMYGSKALVSFTSNAYAKN